MDKKFIRNMAPALLNVCVKTFWSVIPYDPQTRILWQTDQQDAALNSEASTVRFNPDDSINIFLARKPCQKRKLLIKTMPGKGWFPILRLYGASEPWFDKTWRTSEIELINRK